MFPMFSDPTVVSVKITCLVLCRLPSEYRLGYTAASQPCQSHLPGWIRMSILPRMRTTSYNSDSIVSFTSKSFGKQMSGLSQTPTLPPPYGFHSNFIDPPSRADSYIVVVSIAIPLMLLCVCLRLYAKIWLIRSPDWDDGRYNLQKVEFELNPCSHLRHGNGKHASQRLLASVGSTRRLDRSPILSRVDHS